MSEINRVPKGVPTGGEFAEGRRGEAGAAVLDAAYLENTAQLLETHRFVPARQVLVPSTGVNGWWNDAKVAGEYDRDGGFKRMSRTPRGIASIRKTYKGKSFDLTMPSVTSVRRMAESMKPGEPFDLPVSVPRGDGTEELGWVRVARTGGRWSARPLGNLSDMKRESLGAAVTSMLEARRITGNLAEKDQTSLIQAARERKKMHLREGTAPVKSSWIDSLRYDQGSQAMIMTTADGRSYGYQVPPSTYARVSMSYAPGRDLNKNIKGKAPEAKVEQCSQCHRFYATTTPHRCSAGRHNKSGQVRDQRADAGLVTSRFARAFAFLRPNRAKQKR